MTPEERWRRPEINRQTRRTFLWVDRSHVPPGVLLCPTDLSLNPIFRTGLVLHHYIIMQNSKTYITHLFYKQLTALRSLQTTRLKEIVSATDDLVSTFQNKQAQRGFKKLRSELRQFVENYRELPPRAIPVESQLLSALKHRHPRTVWASTTRNGDFYNLDSYERVATAASMDAKTRSDEAIAALNKLLDQLSKDPECAAIASHIAVLQKDVAAWHLKFLDEVKNRSHVRGSTID